MRAGTVVRRAAVEVRVVSIAEALGWLAGLPADGDLPASLAAWSVAVKAALGLVARGRLLPAISPGGFDAWRVGPLDPADEEWLARLAAALPLQAHALPIEGSRPLRVRSAASLLRDCWALRASAPAPLAAVLAAGAGAGVPMCLTLDQLERWSQDARWEAQVVFACENPSVMDATAERLGAACSPLVYVSGQMSIACRLLLGSLVGQGVEVRYHGDFDWGGVEIGNAVMRLGGRPWRFGSQDYRDAVVAAGADGLRGRPVTATWDQALSAAMREMGMSVVEEAVLDDLRADLAAGPVHR
ncbi:MAG TPA: DUF2399 domain-containing protein [Candidatus Dormibacteraeota bacterium]